jgi:hypothetical protein
MLTVHVAENKLTIKMLNKKGKKTSESTWQSQYSYKEAEA